MKRLALYVLAFALVGYWHSPASCQNQDANKSEEKIYEAKEVDRKASVLSQPKPTYTAEATRQHVVGVVKLAGVFAANGEIEAIEVRKGLPAGLTENAVAAARRITFTPAMKDGNLVSQRMILEYTFDLTGRIIHGQQFPRVYYDESCRTYSNIGPQNMIFFTSEKEAKKAGYKKSKMCP